MRLLIEHVLHPSARADLEGPNLERWAALVRWRTRLVAPPTHRHVERNKRVQKILEKRGATCWREAPGLDGFWPGSTDIGWNADCLRDANRAGLDLVVVGRGLAPAVELGTTAVVRSTWGPWVTTLDSLDLALDVVARAGAESASLGSAYAVVEAEGAKTSITPLLQPILRGSKPVEIFDRYALAGRSKKPLCSILELAFATEKKRNVTIFHANGEDRSGQRFDVLHAHIKERFPSTRFVGKDDQWFVKHGHDRFIRCENRVLALGRGVQAFCGDTNSVAMLLDDMGGEFGRILSLARAA